MHSTSLIGSRAKLQDIPKVEQLIVGRLRGFIVDKIVWPRKHAVRLPELGTPAANGQHEDYVWIDDETVMEARTDIDGDEGQEADADPILDQLLGRPNSFLTEQRASSTPQRSYAPKYMHNDYPSRRYDTTAPDIDQGYENDDRQSPLPGQLPPSYKRARSTASDITAPGLRNRPRGPDPWANVRERGQMRAAAQGDLADVLINGRRVQAGATGLR